MPKLNEDYLYQSGEMKLEILLDDNGFQEVLNERKTFSEEDKFLIEYLQLMVRYDMSYTKHFFNIEYHRERHMILPKKGWIHISPSLRAISNNRFEPIPMGYPEWFIIMEFRDMAQLDSAFKRVAPLEGELEEKHQSFNQFVNCSTIQHALFRDWPDTNL